jgi:putative ABC transport system substrate-binding protein
MKRRDFIAGLGVAAALPAIVRAQQSTPTIGFLSTRSPDEAAAHTNAFRSGLEETGYVEGKSVAIEYRWAQGDYGKLPAFAAELLRQPLALMVTPAIRPPSPPRRPRRQFPSSFWSAAIPCAPVWSRA